MEAINCSVATILGHGLKENLMTQKNQQIVNQAGLSNQRVVVLGGSSGIGLAVA
jgi:UDP-N-acetylglucosamine:LPS N-acetylglucosamine transferase